MSNQSVTPDSTDKNQVTTPGSYSTAAFNIRNLLLRGGPLIALLLLSLYLSFATPHFLKANNLANVARQSSITSILAIGQTFVILTGGIDLSVGAMVALSAVSASVLMTQSVEIFGFTVGPIGFWPGMIVAIGVGGLAGLVNGLVITRGRIPDFIATLGTLTAYRGIALLISDGLPVPSAFSSSERVGFLPQQMIWMGSGSIWGMPVAGLIAILGVAVGWFILRYTALGRSIYAVGGNREAARVSGININRSKTGVYLISGLLAGLAGLVLTGRLNSANALMADGEELNSIAAVVIGGTNLFGGEGGVIGSFIGSLITGVLGNGLNLLNVSAFWQRVVQGGVIILVVIFDQWRRRRFSY